MAWCRQATSHYLNQIWLIIKVFSCIHLRAISQEVLMNLICNMYTEIPLFKLLHLPGATELILEPLAMSIPCHTSTVHCCDCRHRTWRNSHLYSGNAASLWSLCYNSSESSPHSPSRTGSLTGSSHRRLRWPQGWGWLHDPMRCHFKETLNHTAIIWEL